MFQLDLFQPDAFQDGTNDVVYLRIDTAFQPNAFQSDGFQENGAPVLIPQEVGIPEGMYPWPLKKRKAPKPYRHPNDDVQDLVDKVIADMIAGPSKKAPVLASTQRAKRDAPVQKAPVQTPAIFTLTTSDDDLVALLLLAD